MSAAITVINLFNDGSITQNTAVSKTIKLRQFCVEGFFSVQIYVTGAGNIDLIWSVSNDGTNFVTPSGTADIFTAFGASSGPGSDGHDFASFDPPLADYLRFTATEQNAGAITLCRCLFAVQ